MDERNEAVSELTKAGTTRHAAPCHRRGRIDARIAETGTPRAGDASFGHMPVLPVQAWRRWANMGTAFAIGVVASVAVMLVLRGGVDEDRPAQAVGDRHLPPFMSAPPVGAGSSDRHTVKPWFAGKLDYAPPVRDLAAE